MRLAVWGADMGEVFSRGGRGLQMVGGGGGAGAPEIRDGR